MKKLLGALAAALVLGASPVAGAAVVNFDNPSLIDIDNGSGRAVYREAGFRLDGEAAGFLTIDGLGSAFSGALVLIDGSTVSLRADGGGPFSFSSLVAGALDPEAGATLSITGIFGDSSRRDTMLALADLGTATLPMWTGLTELRFTADGDLVLDDIGLDAAQVPEPASIATLLLGIGMLAGVRRRAVRKAS
ncbi:PEP-CTERM sorting domain-containing protein [Massilia jejuensis]|uniref:PEP-CTERM sorting domain-containing protein n=1 Tax=Massilia jejuensis TaxID=648894 RepID=A0ABW0PHP5_9BURK